MRSIMLSAYSVSQCVSNFSGTPTPPAGRHMHCSVRDELLTSPGRRRDRDGVGGGALDGGSPMSHVDIRNDHVPCHYFCNFNVDLKMVQCDMSILGNTLCCVVYFCPPLAGRSMSPVDFKKWPCRI